MSRYQVRFTNQARQQARERVGWRRTERPDASFQFDDELAAAVESLREFPLAGTPYQGRQGIRRRLLPATHCHIYDAVDESRALVMIRSIWHAARGRGPRL